VIADLMMGNDGSNPPDELTTSSFRPSLKCCRSSSLVGQQPDQTCGTRIGILSPETRSSRS